jgi:ribonucleoside-diphosphate reductase beta chain
MTAKPVPVPTPETQPFWDGCAAGELRIQRCTDCGRPYFYPRPVCPSCGSRDVEWFTASGRATLYSYVINHRPAPGFEDDAPYAIAVVESFIAVASGFHHGERQVEIELPVFMIGASEEEKLHIAAQIEDEARHTVFFDRFYREVVGLPGDDIMAVLDASFPWVSETFVAPFGLLAYQADELRLNPYDERARVRYGTNYFLWIEGVLALSVMKVTLSYARWRGFLPAYYTGFTATCRDESRHVQGGMRYLQDAVRKDPAMINEIHDTLRTILSVSGVVSRRIYYEPLGWTDDEVRVLFFQQLRRKLNDVGIGLSPDLEELLEIGAASAGGRVSHG